jgi:phosphatidylserine decarboxylase
MGKERRAYNNELIRFFQIDQYSLFALSQTMVRDGYFYGIAFFVVAALVHIFLGGWLWTLVPVLLALFFLWFFRDPQRAIPHGEGLVVSPADGKVTEVARISTPEGETVRISIFLSVFNVHVNRSPVSGTLREVRYQKGKYLNAMNPASAEENEQNLVVIAADEGYTVAFKQIAGLLARRIVFRPQPGAYLARGERVGMIKFGSRVDVLLPGNSDVRVRKGETVNGGSSVLAKIPEPVDLNIEDELLVETLV